MNDRRVIAVIPARMGSKRLPRKNVKLMCGKPLFAWTLDVALKCKEIDTILITTDDPWIVDYVNEVYFDKRIQLVNRPPELATDDATTEDVIKHALKTTGNDKQLTDIIVLLQPTSPLRTLYDLLMALQIYKERVSCSVFSVNYDCRKDKGPTINGAIYVFSIGSLMLTEKITQGEFFCVYRMQEENSIDIDFLTDFEKAEAIMLKRLEHLGENKK